MIIEPIDYSGMTSKYFWEFLNSGVVWKMKSVNWSYVEVKISLRKKEGRKKEGRKKEGRKKERKKKEEEKRKKEEIIKKERRKKERKN
jgi:hypothetical protein